jgi:hypothetical protein
MGAKLQCVGRNWNGSVYNSRTGNSMMMMMNIMNDANEIFRFNSFDSFSFCPFLKETNTAVSGVSHFNDLLITFVTSNDTAINFDAHYILFITGVH